jgi:very-short-patch-repair endonuclease
VVWPESVLGNAALKDTLKEIKGDGVKAIPDAMPSADKSSGFRDKFMPKLRSADGHYVRSRAEMLIDNWLYTAEIVHAYERKLPVEEEVYCDFYLPAAKVYVEFWGMESDEKYRKRKEAKKAIYNQYGFNLIEVHDKDINNLDDVLPRLLLKFGITTY